ncbi:anoctamin-7 isoform X3 [Simochromis diagramma]|uniref:anoctamin-7 isoform X3 n=1 Tax=Simochromis diagramma TaxID=43689 RepID=UPI001A7E7256|nr:anoctamin-7 isoform X3 [Simochromis diagramma]
MRRRGDQREDGTTLITMETSPENNYGTMNAVQPEDGNVFSDGSTRVDFVLVWEEPRSMQEESMGVSPAHRRWREEFLKRLRHSGLLQEQKEVLQTKKRICFVLLSAPWSVLCYYAEEISLRVPLQVVTAPIVNWSEQILSKLSLPNLMSQDVPNPPPDYYTCQFRTNKLERFLGSDNKDTFFKTTQRHQVLYEILARTPYGSVKNGEVGVDRLLNEQVFTAAYPLHEGDYQLPTPPVSPQSLSLRQILYAYWAQWSCWRRYQPLDHIREYFGEKIALYFAWLGFYTGWLLPASVVGTVIFLIGFWLVATDVPANELCGSGNSFIMCPLCNICSYWNYSSICVTYKVAVVLIFLTAIILYRTILSIIIYKSEYSFFSFSAGRIASFSGSVLNLLVILLLSRIYTALAHILTRWEMHRTQTKYEDMFILKVFVFQFVNFYSSPVYIAFFKGRFIGYPGNYNTLFGVRNEDCGAGGCLIDLAQELLVIMVGKQLINNIQEFISPKVKSWWQKRKLNPQLKEAGQEAQRQEEASPWEADYQLLVCEGLFSEYLEMVIQFGFITIFVAACPLAPLFALINNWVEVRLDAQKFVTEYRRPVVERAQDIGIWFPILQFIAHMAVLSNAFLIAFTSSFVPRLYYRYTRDSTLSGFINFTLATSPLSYQQQHNTSCRYWAFRDENGEYLPEYFHLLAIRLGFVIIFEHVVFFIGRLIDLMVPDVSEEVEMKIKREHYMAKEALAENQSLGKTMIPGNGEAPPSELRQRRSRISPQESDPPSPNLEEIAEETEAIFSS